MFNDEEVKALIDAAIKSSVALLGQYSADMFDFDVLKARVYKMLRDLYKETAQVGIGGELSNAQKNALEEAVQEQLFSEIGDESFGLSQKLDDYNSGAVSLALFAASFAMYLRSARTAAFEVWAVKNEDRLVKRRLGATDNHCTECLMYSALPAMKLRDAVIPGRGCSCYSNCLCTLVYVGEA